MKNKEKITQSNIIGKLSEAKHKATKEKDITFKGTTVFQWLITQQKILKSKNNEVSSFKC